MGAVRGESPRIVLREAGGEIPPAYSPQAIAITINVPTIAGARAAERAAPRPALGG
jgi:hypothetical protein